MERKRGSRSLKQMLAFLHLSDAERIPIPSSHVAFSMRNTHHLVTCQICLLLPHKWM